MFLDVFFLHFIDKVGTLAIKNKYFYYISD